MNLTEREKIALDAYIVNNDKLLCYRYAKDSQADPNSESFRQVAWRWFRYPQVVAYINGRREQVFSHKTAEDGELDNRNRDDVIKELNTLIDRETDSKRKGDLLMKLSDLLNFKREQGEDNPDSHVNYYLPLRCSECPLFQSYNQYRDNTHQQDLLADDWQAYLGRVDKLYHQAEKEPQSEKE